MTLRKVLIILFGLLLFLAVAVGLTSINHPIILKWVTGSAKHHGKPMPAAVYINGQVNDHIRVFYTDEEENYLVNLAEYDRLGKVKFLNINLNEKRMGRPAVFSKNDFDIIAGHLFQSKTAGEYSPFPDDINGSNFDPQLTFSGKQIKFNLPASKFKFDSLRIELP